jgi:hypothetical protein
MQSFSVNTAKPQGIEEKFPPLYEKTQKLKDGIISTADFRGDKSICFPKA